MEQIYTIPVNEAFDASAADPAAGCPFCALYNKLEENELDLILGASMMEPDVRRQTNVEGFCHRHYGRMFQRKNRLGLALMLESHLAELGTDLAGEGLSALVGGPGAGAVKRLGRLEHDCYICRRVEGHFSRMYDTVILLWRTDDAFRRKYAAQPFFCLPHYRRLLEVGRASMPKKEVGEFASVTAAIERRYMAALSEDVSWFCKKFDYRYQDEPWKNARDAVERAIRFLSGNEGGGPGGEKK